MNLNEFHKPYYADSRSYIRLLPGKTCTFVYTRYIQAVRLFIDSKSKFLVLILVGAPI